MKPLLHSLAALGLVASAAATAQTTPLPDASPTVPQMPPLTGQPPASPSPDEPPGPHVQRAGSVEYLSGGAGAESRAAIEKMQGRFALRNVFSGQGGEYVVPEKVIVRGASGPATEIVNAGPMLMLALPPGRYTIEAAVGGKVQTRTVTLSGPPVQLKWNWPGA